MIAISGVAVQKLIGGEGYPALLLSVDTLQSATKIPATPHPDFHEYQEAPICCDHVDLSHAVAVVALDDAQAVKPQPGGGHPFRKLALQVCGHQHGSTQGVAADSTTCWLRIWLQTCVRRNCWSEFSVSNPVEPQMVLKRAPDDEGSRLSRR